MGFRQPSGIGTHCLSQEHALVANKRPRKCSQYLAHLAGEQVGGTGIKRSTKVSLPRALETLLLRFKAEYNTLITANTTDNEVIRMEDKLLLKIVCVAAGGGVSCSSGAYSPFSEYRLYSGCGGLHSLTALEPSMESPPSSLRNGRSMVSSAKQMIVWGPQLCTESQTSGRET